MVMQVKAVPDLPEGICWLSGCPRMTYVEAGRSGQSQVANLALFILHTYSDNGMRGEPK